MSNLGMSLYILDQMNCHYTCEKTDDFNWWVIDAEHCQFWFSEDGSYYGTITKIPELED